MSNMYFQCSCEKSLAVDEAGVGRTVKCPDCGRPIVIPPADIHWDCKKCNESMAAPKEMSGADVQCVGCGAAQPVPSKIAFKGISAQADTNNGAPKRVYQAESTVESGRVGPAGEDAGSQADDKLENNVATFPIAISAEVKTSFILANYVNITTVMVILLCGIRIFHVAALDSVLYSALLGWLVASVVGQGVAVHRINEALKYIKKQNADESLYLAYAVYNGSLGGLPARLNDVAMAALMLFALFAFDFMLLVVSGIWLLEKFIVKDVLKNACVTSASHFKREITRIRIGDQEKSIGWKGKNVRDAFRDVASSAKTRRIPEAAN